MVLNEALGLSENSRDDGKKLTQAPYPGTTVASENFHPSFQASRGGP